MSRSRARALRVLVSHPSADLYGSDRMLLEAVRGMLEAGMRPVVVTAEAGPLVDRLRELGAECAVVPTPVLRKAAVTPRGLLRLLLSTVTSARVGWRALRAVRPDVVYVSTLTTPLWLVLARCARVPSVCHVHEAEGEAPTPLRAALALPLMSATRVLVNSRYAMDVLLASVPALAHRSTVVLNGVAGPHQPPRHPAPAAGRTARLLFIGRLSERKGVHVAVEATEVLRQEGWDVRLDLVGDTFPDHAAFAERLRLQLDRPALSGRVEQHGFAGAVWEHLAACDVLLVPSVLPEPFGNTAVEGVLAGRPVVASALGGLPEALEGCASARLVPPGDPRALAAAVRATLQDLPALAEAATRDAAVVAHRHAPHRYRDAVATAVAGVAGVAG